MELIVIKRSGEKVNYDVMKVFNAISKASDASPNHLTNDQINEVTNKVEETLNEFSRVTVELIQDLVEDELMRQGHYEIARRYIRYRHRHEDRRKATKDLMNTYTDMLFKKSTDDDRKRENANINTDGTMGIMLKIGTESTKYFLDNYILPEEFVEMHKECWVHENDKDFSLMTLNCCQIDMLKVIKDGFSTGHGFIREPNSIRSYAAIAAIIIQSNQNDMFRTQFRTLI